MRCLHNIIYGGYHHLAQIFFIQASETQHTIVMATFPTIAKAQQKHPFSAIYTSDQKRVSHNAHWSGHFGLFLTINIELGDRRAC